MAAELPLDGRPDPVAVELMAPSVTSPGLNGGLPERTPNALRDATLEQNPGMKFLELRKRGWLRVTLSAERCTADWHFVDDVRQSGAATRVGHSLSVAAGRIGDGLLRV